MDPQFDQKISSVLRTEHIPAKDVGGFVDRYLLEYRAYQIRDHITRREDAGLHGAWFVGMYFGGVYDLMGYIFRHHFKFMVCIVSTPLSY